MNLDSDDRDNILYLRSLKPAEIAEFLSTRDSEELEYLIELLQAWQQDLAAQELALFADEQEQDFIVASTELH
jgi:hypothetical protein